MAKARSLRKRYILFELRGADLGEELLKRSLYNEALSFFGEFGLSYAALKLVSYDKAKKQGMLRCERDYLEKVLGFLALLDSLDGAPARVVALKSSGTIKSLS
ncbi:MAG: Rpp14/Pop5 family protein [Candidatus ainarchaeum sp.]|nr:Rpp14/Pop5 family protein [Candidatus ainarchaeum sp.]